MAVCSTEEFVVEVELLADVDVDVVGLFLNCVAPELRRQSRFTGYESTN